MEEVKEEAQPEEVIEYLKEEKLIDPIEAAIADMPRFRSVQDQVLAEEYAFYCRAALKAYREKDDAKLEESVEKQQQLILFVSERLEKMPKQDAKAWVEWVGKITDAVAAEQ